MPSLRRLPLPVASHFSTPLLMPSPRRPPLPTAVYPSPLPPTSSCCCVCLPIASHTYPCRCLCLSSASQVFLLLHMPPNCIPTLNTTANAFHSLTTFNTVLLHRKLHRIFAPILCTAIYLLHYAYPSMPLCVLLDCSADDVSPPLGAIRNRRSVL